MEGFYQECRARGGGLQFCSALLKVEHAGQRTATPEGARAASSLRLCGQSGANEGK